MLKSLKIIWITFISVIILCKIYLRVAVIMPLGGILAVLLLFYLIYFVSAKHKIIWYLSIIVFAYGLYELLFISVHAAEQTKMQFYLPINLSFVW